MKKNNDYFGMLTSAARLNEEIFKNITENRQSGDKKLLFRALQGEIFDSLLDEFIAPFERGDILSLARLLERIFSCVCALEAFGRNKESDALLKKLEPILRLMTSFSEMISLLKSFKTPKKLINSLKEHKRAVENTLIGLKREMITQKEPTVFLHEFYSCEEALLEALLFADVETERIIINNN